MRGHVRRMLAILVQTLFSIGPVDGPVRFGVCLPEASVRKGLTSNGALSWRELPLTSQDGNVWVEIAAIPSGDRLVVRSGAALCEPAVVVRRSIEHATTTGGLPAEVAIWEWANGARDERRVHAFEAETPWGGEVFGAGEFLSIESPSMALRCSAALRLPRALQERAGLLPAAGPLGREIREWLGVVARALVELPGLRGSGDYARSGGEVTNLEFDTTLALLRLALALGDESLLQRARRAALHTCDRDLDMRTGLPFRHGKDHRLAAPEPGHAWVQGLLWVGAICADDRMLNAAQQIAHGLAAMPAVAEREEERARDYAWPLHELEAYLAMRTDARLAMAADAMATAIVARYRPDLRLFCFGEGEFVDGDGYFERAWLTGGVVLPALRAHLRRHPDREIQRVVDEACAALAARIGHARGGVPTHWRALRNSVFGEHRAEQDPKAMFMLEGLTQSDLRRLVNKPHVQRGFHETPKLDDPDLATSFTMIARCEWIYR